MEICSPGMGREPRGLPGVLLTLRGIVRPGAKGFRIACVTTSLFDLYKVGVGPSSSHTMGPMRAAWRFVRELEANGKLSLVAQICTEFYGSLALTGIGHGSDRAALAGLRGWEPATIDPDAMEAEIARINATGKLLLCGHHEIDFVAARDLLLHRDQLFPPAAKRQHPNGMRLRAFDGNGNVIDDRVYFSIGGGFLVEDGEVEDLRTATASAVPFPFHSAAELLRSAAANELTISELMLENECAIAAHEADAAGMDRIAWVRSKVLFLWDVMSGCVRRGMQMEGELPGGLKLKRRAKRLAAKLEERMQELPLDPLLPLDWLTVWAMAVNEENAAGGRVVTAPTNGAAGVIPAVAHYYMRLKAGADEEGLLRFYLASAAIGLLYKENASISGAEVGCQGEVGVACSMAAGGLVAALGGSNAQIEHAAEVAMEHNLGMTCDPIAGLVQIPCIERNAMGAAKAVLAARLALNEPGEHRVSLDQVIHTMYQTGLDMQSRYKETSLGGLALNVIHC